MLKGRCAGGHGRIVRHGSPGLRTDSLTAWTCKRAMLVSMRFPRFAAAGEEVVLRPWQPPTLALVAVAATLAGVLLGVGITLFWSRGPLAAYEYHLWRWEADTLVSELFTLTGVVGEPEEGDGVQAIRSYFGLTSELRGALAAGEPDLALIDTLTSERAAYENDVERAVRGYLDDAVGAAGLRERLPLFRSVEVTWPPVAFELTSPPRLLVRSPRDVIRRDGDTLLKNDLTLREIEKIEAGEDSKEQVSLVVAIGGLAAYPAVVRDDRSYDSLLETAAHEWVHHYLAFYPLGQEWGNGGDAFILNESTAELAGRELANLVRQRNRLTLPAGEDGRAPAAPAPTVDFNTEMRKLRLEVDALLAEGKVAEAERLMEERRQYLVANGITIRKLNQAYFAFYGTYGDSPASSSPVGPKVQRVWDLTGDVGTFLRVMREVRTVADLDKALERLERSAP